MENAQRDWGTQFSNSFFDDDAKIRNTRKFFEYKENVYKGISNDIYNRIEFNKCIFDGLKHSWCPFIAFSPM